MVVPAEVIEKTLSFEFEVGGKLHRAGPGETVFGPRNIQHRFRYAGESGVGRLIIIYTPAGPDWLFKHFNELTANGIEVTAEMFAALADRQGAYLV